ncbi:tetratricopeptide repeat protein, partial [Candidatus Aerophobetes bacterium]|nr:tetratricopeptide repeat protein [Candidatus Aerophobetes bacterium]
MNIRISYFCIFSLFIFIFAFIFFPQTGFADLQADLHEVKSYIEEGKFEEALDRLNKIIEISPELAEAHLLLGEIYEKKAKLFLEKAIEEYRKALVDKKIGTVARKNLAKLFVEKGDYQQAEGLLSAIPEEKRDFEVLKLLGTVLFKQDRPTEALNILEKAYSLNPSDLEVLFTLARIYE